MSSRINFSEAIGIQLPERTTKPRKHGITMVIDVGHTWQETAAIAEGYGAYIDVVKLADGNLFQANTEIQKKIDVLRLHDIEVQPGGIIIEIARWQNKLSEVLRKLKAMGFTQIEISSSATTQRDMSEEVGAIKLGKDLGFRVFGEVGKKFSEGDKTRVTDSMIDVDETIREMKTCLSAGADHVYWEGHLLRRFMGETPHQILGRRHIFEPIFDKIDKAIGAQNIVFEVSSMVGYVTRRAMQYWLTRTFGPNVNIGNCKLWEVPTVEGTRCGTYPVFGFGPTGDHAWIQSLAAHNGRAHEKWWQEFPAYPTPEYLEKASDK